MKEIHKLSNESIVQSRQTRRIEEFNIAENINIFKNDFNNLDFILGE
jgi:hypothetical protein